MAIIRRKKIIRRRKKGTAQKLYFHAGTQAAIESFQNTEDLKVREVLYTEEILPAFDKLVENLIFMHGFHKQHDSFEMLKNDCVSFLYETIHKWKPERGTKAFSYFNVVARNWLIIKSKQRNKSNRRHISIDDQESLSIAQKLAIENSSVVLSQDEQMIAKNRINEILSLLQEIKIRTTNENEILCINAIIKIFSHIDDLEFLNKRAIFVYIRDLSSLNPKKLSVAMSQIRKHYKELARSDDFGIF
tara:strand:- start:1303 stop:2040 length:738 start_codon:yes stop_codon:yes gene_type:complete